MSSLNYSEATRSPRKTFRRLKQEHNNCILIGDSVITRRLMSRNVALHACPKSVEDGFGGKLGRINYAAAINNDDSAATAALKEETARRDDELNKRFARYKHTPSAESQLSS